MESVSDEKRQFCMRMCRRWWIVRTGEKVGYETSCDFCQILLTMIGIRFWIWWRCLVMVMDELIWEWGGVGPTGTMNERFGAPEPGFWTWTVAIERDKNLGGKYQEWWTIKKKGRVVYKERITIDTRSGIFPIEWHKAEKKFFSFARTGQCPIWVVPHTIVTKQKTH